MGTVYDQVGGYERLRALAGAWHDSCLADEIMNHPFSHPGAHDHLDRLASYWAEQLGGPSLYTGRYGDETSVVRRHAGNGEHPEMDERAVTCFAQALDDIGVDEGVLRSELLTWFAHETGQLARYPRSPHDVPDDLPLRVWGSAGS
jgi:hemoglobin